MGRATISIMKVETMATVRERSIERAAEPLLSVLIMVAVVETGGKVTLKTAEGDGRAWKQIYRPRSLGPRAAVRSGLI